MNQQIPDPEMVSPILTRVKEGMTVVDQNGDKIGEVETVVFGSVGEGTIGEATGPADSTTPPNWHEGTIVDMMAKIFDDDDDDAGREIMEERLAREGFFKVNSTGLFSSDWYVTPDQVEAISEDLVQLNTGKDSLLKD
ncbi:MAG: hypothetical protein EHM41_17035 [Chloroflexi bacterium]|nr:MAG: hypothetical protein EHM41_17035 [Chloroflexota bacterium]